MLKYSLVSAKENCCVVSNHEQLALCDDANNTSHSVGHERTKIK